MSSKVITLILAVIVVVLLIAFFVSQNYIYDGKNKIKTKLNDISKAVRDNDWTSTRKYIKEFEKLWLKGKYLIALNSAGEDYSSMNDAIAVLKGAAEAKDDSTVLQNVKKLKSLWQNFRKFVPEP